MAVPRAGSVLPAATLPSFLVGLRVSAPVPANSIGGPSPARGEICTPLAVRRGSAWEDAQIQRGKGTPQGSPECWKSRVQWWERVASLPSGAHLGTGFIFLISALQLSCLRGPHSHWTSIPLMTVWPRSKTYQPLSFIRIISCWSLRHSSVHFRTLISNSDQTSVLWL